MTEDFRIMVGFFRHHKTRKLERRLGLEGVLALLKLWEYSAEFRTRGDLAGMTTEDIELASGWDSERPIVPVFVEVGFLDEGPDSYVLHDWQEHNPWVSEADERSASARLSRLHRENPEAAEQLKAEGRTGLTSEEYRNLKRSTIEVRSKYDRTTTVERPLTSRTTPVPVPVPIPAPVQVPDPVPEEKISSSAKASKKCPADPSPAFDEFWKIYPSRNGVKARKADAWKAFWRVTTSGEVTPGALLAAITVLAPQYGDFPRDAASWLNQRGWEDEVGPVRVKQARSGELPKSKAQILQEQNAAAMQEWLESKEVQQ